MHMARSGFWNRHTNSRPPVDITCVRGCDNISDGHEQALASVINSEHLALSVIDLCFFTAYPVTQPTGHGPIQPLLPDMWHQFQSEPNKNAR